MSIDALLSVDKPQGWTSHDVVDFLRRLTGWKRVGHFGSLDPIATGLLLIGIGRATRLFPFLSKLPKTYRGTIRFGQATDTYDATGKPISPASTNFPQENELKEIIKSFEGEIEQLPPPFSAKKYKGQPLYRLARRGRTVPLQPIKVKIYWFKFIEYNPPDFVFEVLCSSGTYVRSLAHDLGQMAGCGAYLAQLTRLAIGPFHLNNAFSPEKIENSFKNGQVESLICPLEKVMEDLPKAILSEKLNLPLVKGKIIPPQALLTIISPAEESSSSSKERIVRLFSFDGRFLGFARAEAKTGNFIPFLLV